MTLASIDQVTIAATRLEKARALPTPVLPAPFGTGTGSAVPLRLPRRIDRAAPVILLETGKPVPEMLRHRHALVGRLGLPPAAIAALTEASRHA